MIVHLKGDEEESPPANKLHEEEVTRETRCP